MSSLISYSSSPRVTSLTFVARNTLHNIHFVVQQKKRECSLRTSAAEGQSTFFRLLAKGSFIMKAKLFLVAVFAFALTFVGMPLSEYAQTTTTGTVEGTVIDHNGAAGPNVSVHLSST